MQLINTKVVPAKEDLFWVLPSHLPELSGVKLLVISAPFPADGPESVTLSRMMTACKLSADDYTLIFLPSGERISWQMLRGKGAPDRVLLAGVSPIQLGINALLRPYTCNAFLGARFIPAASLTEIEGQPTLKRQLWEEGLKPCFGL